MSIDLCFLTIAELSARYRSKQLSPVEVTRAALDQLGRLNLLVNSVPIVATDRALEQARRAESAYMAGDPCDSFCGVPVTIKDMLWTKDITTTFGSVLFKDFIPPEDAPVVARLKEAGAVILGKAATSEFAWLGATHSRIHGITRNPWNLDLTPGGSSGGSAVAVATGVGPMSVGTDAGASIRGPAAYCGVVGLHPSYGRVPQWPLGNGYDLTYVGPITRTVADAAISLDVLSRPDSRDWQSLPPPTESFQRDLNDGVAGLRIAFSPDLGFARVQPEVASVAAAAARVFAELGADVEQNQPPIEDPIDIYQVVWIASMGQLVRELGPERMAHLDAGLVRQAELARRFSVVDYMDAQARRHALCRRLQEFFERYDLLLTPTMPDVPWPAGLDYPPGNPPNPPDSVRRVSLCYTFSLSHQPALSVPCGFTSAGLPVGLQIVGPRFGDRLVLRAAAAFERARPWAHRRPPCIDQQKTVVALE